MFISLCFVFRLANVCCRWGGLSQQIMNNADLMSSAYASYAQNIATLGVLENHSLIDQLQSLLKSNGVQAHSSGALQRKLSTDQVNLLSQAPLVSASVRHACTGSHKHVCAQHMPFSHSSANSRFPVSVS